MISISWPPKFLKKIPSLYLVMMSNTLEFFDFFLYVHMAAILHQVFFPYGSFFISETFSLVNLYFIAPILSIFFALWGDTRGRKPVIIFCSIIMAISTFLMIFIPSYSQAGVLSVGCFIFLRVLQGISLAGEPVSGVIYIIESATTKRSSFYIPLFRCTEGVGSLMALLLAFVTFHYNLSWRIPFIGAFIVVLFSLSLRYTLEETPEYVRDTELKTNIKIQDIEEIKNFYSRLPYKQINTICSALINFGYPFAFVTSYLTLGKYLRDFYGYTLEDIVLHNMVIVGWEIVLGVLLGYCTFKSSVAPQVVQVYRMIFGLIVSFIMPIALSHYHSVWLVSFFQIVFVSCFATDLIIAPVLKVFPVIGRFSLSCLGFVCNRFIAFFLMTFVLHYLVEQYGLWGNVAMMTLGCTLVFIGIYFAYLYTEEEFEKPYVPFQPQYL